jgi:hypothetical protein
MAQQWQFPKKRAMTKASRTVFVHNGFWMRGQDDAIAAV